MIARALEEIARYERPLIVTLFVAFASVLCLFFARAVPVSQAPDEVSHALRADSVRHGVIIGSRWALPPITVVRQNGSASPEIVGIPWSAAGGLADPALFQAVRPVLDASPGAPVTPSMLRDARAVPWLGPIQAEFRNTVQYPPTFYLGAALALQAAHQLGIGPYDAMIGVRLINIAQFLVLGGLALWFAVAGRLCLFVVLTLPMTLFVAASTSQDGIMIATAALAVALVSRMWLQPALPTTRLALLTLVMIAFIVARPTNAPLALLLLLPQPGINWRDRGAAFLTVAAATLCWVLLSQAAVSVPLRPEADVGEQLALLKADPSRFLAALKVAIEVDGVGYLEQMIGRLGLLQVLLPPWLLQLYLLPIAAAIIGDMVQPTVAPRLRLPATLLIVGGVATLTAIAQFLTWTPVGMIAIDGVQGRYFLPAALVVGLGVAGLVPVAARWPRAIAVLGIMIGPAVSAAIVPGLIVAHYYGF